MNKSFAALGTFALLAALAMALPGFAPKLEASEVAALAKGDRLAVRSTSVNCLAQTWPHFTTSCLQNTSSSQQIAEARVVTAGR
ncbi:MULTISPECIES: hypothetical protein [unclassified Bradyrhizobium]|uniref:hypothetical protein n=1 Tax=unclassified Bradyrhizobium TaxID=2631580 RepID=UPI0024E11E6A|nr:MULTISPECIES: hypothetical protein [unclassified Bradyrhizobium]